ncbi:hypothetical protein [Halomonas sp. FME65]|uniref:hypothetical protein n=1 Tax=Halomonas sp. FME65 TaxID=2742614 RepID=UPI001865EEEA|nr:hypothetical protein [Halomonas sp. FME65]
MKKQELIIHVGTHKTGTSAIQASLYNSRDNMRLHYFDFGEPNHSHVITSLFLKKPDDYHFHRKQARDASFVNSYIDKWKAELCLQISSSNKDRFLISAEDLCTLKAEELLEMKAFFDEFFFSIKIICYLRPPVSYMQSFFQQRLKGGVIDLDFERLYPNYQNLVVKFFDVFGESQCEFVKFSPEGLLSGDVVIDFINRINEEGSVDPVRVNERMSAEATALLFIHRRFKEPIEPSVSAVNHNKRILRLIERFGSKKFLFGESFYNFVENKKHYDIDWLEKAIGFSMGEEFDCYSKNSVVFNEPQDFVKYGKSVYMDFIKEVLAPYDAADVRVKDIIKAIDTFAEWK